MIAVERLRLFVAVAVPDTVRGAVARACDDLRERWLAGRWVAPSNQHVTLKFLGATPADRVDAVRRVCSIVAASHAPSTVAVTHLGSFPSARRARVLWAGLDDPAGLLAALARDLEAGFEPLGYAAEARAYTPHLTVARFKIPVPVTEPLPALAPTDPFEVSAIDLMRSHLHPKGARYETFETFPLK